MKIDTAIRLIQKGVDRHAIQVWADFGAGKGLFTHALATLLAQASTIYAIDKDSNVLNSIEESGTTIDIRKMKLDFIQDNINVGPLDGAIMANSLHFADDKLELLLKIKKNLKSSGCLIVVEYDMEKSNHWVPYPVSFKSLQRMAGSAGFTTVVKLEETPSVYNQANIYAAVLR